MVQSDTRVPGFGWIKLITQRARQKCLGPFLFPQYLLAYNDVQCGEFASLTIKKERRLNNLYAQAGVNLSEAEEATKALAKWLPGIGHFAGFFPKSQEDADLSWLMLPIPPEVSAELLGSGPSIRFGSTVKRQVELALERYGYTPTFAVDYIGVAKLRASIMDKIGQSFMQAQNLVGFKVIGGETAEMPDVYREGSGEVVFWVAGQKGKPRPLSWEKADRFHVVSVDGVGTKSIVALDSGLMEGLPYDLVHHGVNDLMCTGAVPTAFYAYLGVHSLVSERAIEILEEGVAKACQEQGLTFMGCLVEKKDEIYRPGKIDFVGMICGEVLKEEIITGALIKPDDVLIGLPSSGLHTNGYSLARDIISWSNLGLLQTVEEISGTIAEVLLRPHRSYREVIQKVKGEVKAIAHITGGGFYDNIERLLPAGCKAVIKARNRNGRWLWPRPAEFAFLDQIVEEQGKSLYRCDKQARIETFRAFNQGIGLVLIVSPENLRKVGRKLPEHYRIGEIVESEERGVKVIC